MTCDNCWLPPECSEDYCKHEHKSMSSLNNTQFRSRPRDYDDEAEELNMDYDSEYYIDQDITFALQLHLDSRCKDLYSAQVECQREKNHKGEKHACGWGSERILWW